jgi:uncharacterized protein YdeI (YjbR/CyaY-like superfamily)
MYFAAAEAFRSWLERHAATATELIVGFHKRATDTPSITWPQSVDEALCFGWIDGVRKRIDEQRYLIRFTPRKPSSTWSAVNIERIRVLAEQGRMQAAGLEAFARRSEKKSRTYAYEQAEAAALDPADEASFRKCKAAWAFFQKQPPSYRQRLIWTVVSAKQPATRRRRLAQLVQACQESKCL